MIKTVEYSPETSAPLIKREGINWITVVAFTIFHLGALAAPFFFTWPAFITALVLYWMSMSFGIGMGYHRLLTHRGYKVPKAIEYFLAICGTMALEGGPVFWVATHRIHHQFSDKDGDPHTPRDGRWWAHIVWMLVGNVTHCDTAMCAKYAPDLAKDRFLMWLSRYHWVPLTVLGILFLAFGGLPFLFWGIFFRVTMGLHATWLVNSATHIWGKKRFATRDDSKNNWWVALITFGEGWHNNHHAHPVSARHGLRWYEIDPNFYGIWLLSKLGLAKKIRIAQYDPADPKPAGM